MSELNQTKCPLNYLIYEMEITIKTAISLNIYIIYILTIKENNLLIH